MKYLGKLFLSLKEIFIMMIMQYVILILCIFFLGIDKSVILGSIILMILQIIYIMYKIYKGNDLRLSFSGKSYFPYVLMGIGVAVVYNMIIFKVKPPSVVTVDIPIILNILCSGIVGPIFEEFLFRYDLIRRLSKFNSDRWTIIILASIIFGLFHNGIITIIYTVIVGLINSYIYIRNKDITKPIMVHVAGNIFVNLLTEYNLIVLLLGIILIIVSYFIIRCDD